MTISKDLFLAILSMDAYNRGYDAGMTDNGSNDPDGLGEAGSHIGNATVKAVELPQNSESVGFYAIAYTLGATVGEGNDTMASGQTIISYRGTDNILGLGTPASDLFNGWAFGAGIQTSTLGLAREFYEAVTGTDAFNTTGNAILTGHSMGGGLAGHVANLSSSEALLFDNEPFAVVTYLEWVDEAMARYGLTISGALDILEGIVPNTTDMALPNISGMQATFYDNEALELPRSVVINLQGIFADLTVEGARRLLENSKNYGTFVRDNISYVDVLTDNAPDSGSGSKHAIQLFIIQKFFEETHPQSNGWENVFGLMTNALFNDAIGEAAGFTASGINGAASAANKMGRAIAYSVIDEGARIFGDTAIRAMFNDLEEIGTRVGSNSEFFSNIELSTFGIYSPDALAQSLTDAIVQFASEMALRKVLQSSSPAVLEGIVRFTNDGQVISGGTASTADVMHIDLSPELWNIGKSEGDETVSPTHFANWIEAALAAQFADDIPSVMSQWPNGIAGLVSDLGLSNLFATVYDAGMLDRGWSDIRLTTQYLNGASFIIETENEETVLVDHHSGSDQLATLVFATDNNDTVQGSAGNEVFLAGNGNDSIKGGGGADILFGDMGNDTLVGGTGDDFLIGDKKNDGPELGIDSNDLLDMGTGSDTAIGGAGNDTILGAKDIDPAIDSSQGHNNIDAGLGSDSVDAGDGADRIFDNGSAAPWTIADHSTFFEIYAMAYDGAGNDTIHGGKGSDWIYTSGGDDSVYGGQGNDIYGVSGWAAVSTAATDSLDIHVADTAAEGALGFGNDLILGAGQGIDRLIFDGISRENVEIRYNFVSTYHGTIASNFEPLFGWTIDGSFEEATVFTTLGSLEIRVINGAATGSSVTIEQVSGSYSMPSSGNMLLSSGAILNPFQIIFSDGSLNLGEELLQQGANPATFFTNSTLSDTALVAPDSYYLERNTREDTVTGSNGGGGGARSLNVIDSITGNDVLSGSNAANLLGGLAGDDTLYGLHGDDWLEGGLGGDVLYGGGGSDTATYANATSAISAYLDPARFTTVTTLGDAVGDEYVSIENMIGSAYNDWLSGDDGANRIEGGAGNDRIFGLGGLDTLIGGDGNDSITAGSYVDDDHILYVSDTDMYGGAGNDTIRSASGNDRMFGGDGADTFELSSFVNIYSPGTPGNDTMDGGAGIDRVEFFSGPVIVDLGAGTAQYVGTYESVRLISVENIGGSWKNDLLIGSDGNNLLSGNDGNDTLVGGLGNDTLEGTESYSPSNESNAFYGGVGIDTAVVFSNFADASFTYVEGGISITTGTVVNIIYKDVEFIRFNNQTVTYQSIAAGLQTAFGVIDDYVRIEEGTTQDIAPFANDLLYQGSPLSLIRINGAVVAQNDVIRLASGATLTVLANGVLRLDQAGAYAWLDADESALETLTYTATDSTGIQRTADLTVIVDGAASSGNQLHLDVPVAFGDTDPTQATARRIANFDIGRGAVVIDGVLVNPNAPPVGVTLQEVNGDTYVIFGDDAVILSDISLAAWQFRFAQGQAGGAGNETLNGTSAAELISGNGGNDTLNGNGGYDVLAGGIGNDRMTLGNQGGVILGEAGSDTLNGGVGLDRLYGGDGNDIAYGGAGNDLIEGGNGNDNLAGDVGDDTIYGGAGDDTISGGRAADLIFGGNSTFSGRDVLDGGEGFDIVTLQPEYSNGTAVGAVVDLARGWISWNGAVADEQILNFEGAFGSSANDTLLGNNDANQLDGVGGDDLMLGAGGNDTITDGYGNDTIYGDVGNDIIYDTAGNDLIFGGDGNDNIRDNAGNDSIYGGAGDDTLRSYVGADVIDGGDGIDTIDLSVGSTTLHVDIDLAAGIILGTTAPVSLISIENATGSQGNNRITGTSGVNMLDGGQGNDTLFGQAGNDTLIGGGGNDLLDGETGIDSLTGGLGNDVYVVDNLADTVVEITGTGQGTDIVQSSVNWALSAYVENLTLTGSAAISGTGNIYSNILTGNAAANLISGLEGNDTIVTGDGNDTLDGGAGLDTMTGGAGIDTANFSGTAAAVVNLSATIAQNTVGYGIDTLLGIENVTSGSGNDSLTGDALANGLSSGAGNDSLSGGAGNDTLNGGAGVDQMTGGADNDSYVVDAAGDTTIEIVGGGTADAVTSSVTFTLAVEVENLTLSGTAAINGTGNAVANILTGNTGANVLTGLAGNDSLVGGAGNDTLDGGTDNDTLNGGTGVDSMTGGAGNDLYVVGEAADKVIEGAAGGTDTVQSAISFTLGVDVENLTLLGTAAINGVGNASANTIVGNTAANTLLGGAGNDILNGGTGTDSLTGSLGNDTYIIDVATDIVVELANEGTDLVKTAVTHTLLANFENLTLLATTAINGTGNAVANVLTGGTGANILSGLAGNDTLAGGTGNDTMVGGTGADAFVFVGSGNGTDTISDFNELNGGAEEGDVLQINGALVGTFVYRGASAFTGGSNNSEARISGSQVLVDANGDGVTDITITLSGLTAATQLAATDFVFV